MRLRPGFGTVLLLLLALPALADEFEIERITKSNLRALGFSPSVTKQSVGTSFNFCAERAIWGVGNREFTTNPAQDYAETQAGVPDHGCVAFGHYVCPSLNMNSSGSYLDCGTSQKIGFDGLPPDAAQKGLFEPVSEDLCAGALKMDMKKYPGGTGFYPRHVQAGGMDIQFFKVQDGTCHLEVEYQKIKKESLPVAPGCKNIYLSRGGIVCTGLRGDPQIFPYTRKDKALQAVEILSGGGPAQSKFKSLSCSKSGMTLSWTANGQTQTEEFAAGSGKYPDSVTTSDSKGNKTVRMYDQNGTLYRENGSTPPNAGVENLVLANPLYDVSKTCCADQSCQKALSGAASAPPQVTGNAPPPPAKLGPAKPAL
jgi:hypothetical protein